MSLNAPIVRIGDVVDRVTKGTTPTTHGYQYTRDGVAFVRVENLRNGIIDSSTLTSFISVDADRFLKRSSLQKDDVLVSIAGTIGRTAVVREQDLPANTNQAVAIIRGANKTFEPIFLRYALESPLLNRLLTGEARGGAMQNISLEDVKNVEVPVPPLDEQREIVAEIEKQFTRLDAGIAGLRRVQANLKRYRAAVLKAACEGKLVPIEAELARQEGRSYETGAQLLERILTERRKKWNGKGKYREPEKPDTPSLPLLPEGWTWASLESITNALGGYAFESKKFCDSGFQVLKMANVRMGRTDLNQRPSFIAEVNQEIVDKYKLMDGDVVVTLTGSRKKEDYGYVAVIKNADSLLLNQRIARLRCTGGILPAFLEIAMQSKDFRKRFFSYETGNVGQGNVGMTAIIKESIPILPLAEQQRIVAEVERRLSVVEELEAVVNANLQRATRLRQSILQQAFDGQLFAPERDQPIPTSQDLPLAAESTETYGQSR